MILELKREIEELRRTIQVLQKQITGLTTASQTEMIPEASVAAAEYEIIPEAEEDASWTRLIGILKAKPQGLTAKELATLWGKSRSRTSEVLNLLAARGRIIKYRDGRNIRFRTP